MAGPVLGLFAKTSQSANILVLKTLMAASKPAAIDDGSVFNSSERIRSSLPRTAATVPAFAVRPDWKTTAGLGPPLNFRNLFFGAMCRSIVPAIVRTAPAPTAGVRIASIAARRSASCVVRPR